MKPNIDASRVESMNTEPCNLVTAASAFSGAAKTQCAKSTDILKSATSPNSAHTVLRLLSVAWRGMPAMNTAQLFSSGDAFDPM